MNANFTYFLQNEGPNNIESNRNGGQYVENTQSIKKDVSLVNPRFF